MSCAWLTHLHDELAMHLLKGLGLDPVEHVTASLKLLQELDR